MCLDDATVLGLVEGRLAAAAIATIDEHLDACASCRDVVAVVARGRGSAPVLARGHTIGRYVVGDLLGAGAMGRVYSAWQPELDRRVAIKVMRDDTAAQDRVVREAQAMARLNHPNVVTVHEVGTTDDGVYVAMELVAGDTLRAWAARPKPWREVVRVLGEIARGLTAVHAAGVIHRDIKPDNIIVGDDGRARLGDFGLARARPGAEPTDDGVQVEASAIAGTPAYMAPEVLRGERASAASDQFGFGVVAYELFAGKRPFAGASWAELLRAIEDGPPRALRGVPSWLDTIVRRCLAADPRRRFASLAEVAARLAAHAQRRTTAWIAAAATAAVLASAATWFVLRDRGGATCAVDDRELAAIWNPTARARFASAPVTAALDRWTDAFRDARTALCNAPPSARTAAREHCLDQRKAELAVLVASAPADDRVLDALAALPPPSECSVVDAGAADPLPLDPARAAAAQEVGSALPALRASIALGDTRANVDPAAALVAKARASGHAPTLAAALVVEADALHGASRFADAALAARDAVAAAERGRADAAAADAWLARVAIAGDRRELDSADDLGAIAVAAIERAGSPPHLAATLARLRGLIAYERGNLADARALLADARARLATIAGEHSVEVSAVDSALGSVARASGDLDEAEARHRAALAVDRELRTVNHPDIARDLHNLAGVLRLRGDLDHALATYREALAVEVAAHGDTSVAAGLTHNSLGLVQMARGDWSGAADELARARDILAAAGHGDRAFAEHNLGLVAQATGDHRGALQHFARAADIYASTIGASPPAAIRLALDRARSERALHDEPAARRDALAARTAAQAAGIPWIVEDADALLAAHGPARPARPAEPLPPAPRPAQAPTVPLPAASRTPPPAPKRDVGVYGANVPF